VTTVPSPVFRIDYFAAGGITEPRPRSCCVFATRFTAAPDGEQYARDDCRDQLVDDAKGSSPRPDRLAYTGPCDPPSNRRKAQRRPKNAMTIGLLEGGANTLGMKGRLEC
jgi:hypothetical protein